MHDLPPRPAQEAPPTPEMIRARLPDHASHADHRGVPIDRVGISGLRWPITVWDREEKLQSTVATIDATVTLPADQKGTHMSRFVEVLNGVRGELSLKNLPGLCAQVQHRLGAHAAQIDVRFPYFMTRHAPVSRAASLLAYEAGFHAERTGDEFRFELEVRIPVTTVCPCSKAISDRGAHNQRGIVTVRLRPHDFMWIEDVVEAVESCASAPLYTLLKREDEKWVTEQAYDNPVFVEDLIREVVVTLRDRVAWMRVSVENVESIHAHSAWATLEWPGAGSRHEAAADVPAGSAPVSGPLPPQAARTPFGHWLRGERLAHTWSQQDLAARIGVSAPHLSKVEAGERNLPDASFEALGEALGRSPSWLRLRAGVIPAALLERIQADPDQLLSALGG